MFHRTFPARAATGAAKFAGARSLREAANDAPIAGRNGGPSRTAENLSFAASRDSLMQPSIWSFRKNGAQELERYIEGNRKVKEDRAQAGKSRAFQDAFMAYSNVTVYDSTENKRVPAELPDNAPCNRIVAVLVQKLQLPVNGADGAPLSYKFHHKNSGRQIQDAQTRADAAVKEGDILRLQPEITAG